jgi:DNA-binding NarL/FixJ family response regulator
MMPTQRPSAHHIARSTIEAQRISQRVRASAWQLYEHELDRMDPHTGKPYTPRKALRNVMLWIEGQRKQQEKAKCSPTPRQRLVLQMMVSGMKQNQIAERLGISVRTLKYHFSSMKSRLGVETLYQVVAISVQEGWIKPPKWNGKEIAQRYN